MVNFARELSLRGVYRGLPVEPLDATAVDAGVEELLELLGSGFPVEPLDATAVDAGVDALLGSGAPELSRGPHGHRNTTRTRLENTGYARASANDSS